MKRSLFPDPVGVPTGDMTAGLHTELLQPLVHSLGYRAYAHTGGTLVHDHVFWFPLLPYADAGGEVLVLENKLGALTLRLAELFRKVHSVPATATDAETLSRLLALARPRNVQVVAPDDIEHASFVGLRALILLGPFVSEPNGTSTSALVERMLERADSWLASDGVLVMADNNAWSYRRWKRRRTNDVVFGRWNVRALFRQARRSGRYVECFVNRGVLTPHLFPPPELAPLDKSADTSGVSLKERILHSRWGKCQWPSYLCLTSRTLRQDETGLARIVRTAEIGERMKWARRETVGVKRLIAGHAGVTVAVVGPTVRHDADVVFRLPGTADGIRRCLANADALQYLAGTDIAQYVPRLLVADALGHRRYYVETRCPGWDSETAGISADVALRSAFALLFSFHEHVTVDIELSSESYDEVAGVNFHDLRLYLEPAHQMRLRAIEAWVKAALSARSMRRGFTHGDFKLGNLLFAKGMASPYVIDWDCSCRHGFPLLDYLTLLSYKVGRNVKGFLQQAYLEHILPWRLSDSDARAGERVAAAFGATEREFLALRILLGFAFLRDRHESFLKSHPTWHAEFVVPIFNAVEREMERIDQGALC